MKRGRMKYRRADRTDENLSQYEDGDGETISGKLRLTKCVMR
jgi:hypothetical protein